MHATLTEKQPTLLRLKNKQIKCANSIYKILNRFAYFSVGTVEVESSSLNIAIKYMGGILIYVPTKKKVNAIELEFKESFVRRIYFVCDQNIIYYFP